MVDIYQWGWAQVAYLCLILVGVGLSWSRDGKFRTGKHSFAEDMIAASVCLTIILAGGFFS